MERLYGRVRLSMCIGSPEFLADPNAVLAMPNPVKNMRNGKFMSFGPYVKNSPKQHSASARRCSGAPFRVHCRTWLTRRLKGAVARTSGRSGTLTRLRYKTDAVKAFRPQPCPDGTHSSPDWQGLTTHLQRRCRGTWGNTRAWPAPSPAHDPSPSGPARDTTTKPCQKREPGPRQSRRSRTRTRSGGGGGGGARHNNSAGGGLSTDGYVQRGR